jgi:hypothetical protein
VEENFQRLIGFESFSPLWKMNAIICFRLNLGKMCKHSTDKVNPHPFYMLLEKLKLLIKLVDSERTDALASHFICNHSKRALYVNLVTNSGYRRIF